MAQDNSDYVSIPERPPIKRGYEEANDHGHSQHDFHRAIRNVLTVLEQFGYTGASGVAALCSIAGRQAAYTGMGETFAKKCFDNGWKQGKEAKRRLAESKRFQVEAQPESAFEPNPFRKSR